MILACDIGTSTVKAGIIDEKGALMTHGREPVLAPASQDFSVAQWQRALKKVVHKLDKNISGKIRALVVSGNGPTIVLIDKHGRPLAPVLLWYDNKQEEATTPGCLSYFLPKLAWLKKHRARLYEKTRYFLPCPEYICYLITGEACTALPHQGYREYFWSEAEIAALGLDGDKFPQFISFTTPVGKVSHAAHLEFTLPEGIPVFSGGPDFLMSLLGTAVVVPGCTLDRAGSSEGINHCVQKAAEHSNLRSVPGVLEHTFNVSGILPFPGRIMEQSVVEYYPHASSFTYAIEEALTSAPGAEGLLFIPSLKQPAAWQKFGSVFGKFITPGEEQREQSPGIKLRAILEALTMKLRLILENMREFGFSITEMSISGGQAQSQTLMQLKANILGTSIKVPSIIDAELLGGACVAFTGLGEYSSVQEAASALVRFERIIEPRQEYTSLYEEKFKRFKDMVF